MTSIGEEICFVYYIKHMQSTLRWVWSLKDHRGRHTAIGTWVTHSPAPSLQVFLFLPHNDFMCDLLLNRCTAKWTLQNVAKWEMRSSIKEPKPSNNINCTISWALQDQTCVTFEVFSTLDGISLQVHCWIKFVKSFNLSIFQDQNLLAVFYRVQTVSYIVMTVDSSSLSRTTF